jgi:hypothetical protein
LGKAKSQEDLFEFVCKLGKSKKAAFRQEGNIIQHYLYQHHYFGKYIREYICSSCLGIISTQSFKSFFELGDAIHQLASDHPNWVGGPVKAMLSFHSDKLMEICQFAVSRKQLILQVYTYLGDEQAKEFYLELMAGATWEWIRDLSGPSPSGRHSDGGGGGSDVTHLMWLVQSTRNALSLQHSGTEK